MSVLGMQQPACFDLFHHSWFKSELTKVRNRNKPWPSQCPAWFRSPASPSHSSSTVPHFYHWCNVVLQKEVRSLVWKNFIHCHFEGRRIPICYIQTGEQFCQQERRKVSNDALQLIKKNALQLKFTNKKFTSHEGLWQSPMSILVRLYYQKICLSPVFPCS